MPLQRHLHSRWDEFCGVVDVLLVIAQYLPVRSGNLRLMGLLHEAKGFADQIQVVAEIADSIIGNLRELAKQSRLIADVADQLAQRQHRIGA
jgi:hypothetical protein